MNNLTTKYIDIDNKWNDKKSKDPEDRLNI